jgi:DNA-3-methyladenine glycosylase
MDESNNPHIISQSFFARPTLEVCNDLLGKFLVRQLPNGEKIQLMINVVEAYDGPHDLASHARAGKTDRTALMYGPAGHWYIYLIYGMHWMLNIITVEVEYPAGILIRGA